MRFALDVAQAKDFSFRNAGEMGRFKPSFSRFSPFLAALCALRTDCSRLRTTTASWRTPDSPNQTG